MQARKKRPKQTVVWQLPEKTENNLSFKGSPVPPGESNKD